MDIKLLNIDELIPYNKNPRDNDNAVEAVANSIKEFGFKVPIVLDKNNVIVAGHTRYKASKLLKLEKVPCIIADDLTDEQIKAFRLADNKVGELATWDIDLLSGELDSISIDMEQFGFTTDDIDVVDIVNDDTYTKEINIPQYDITGDMPTLNALVDTSKADELIEQIHNADIDEDVKAFLKKAAARHFAFNYQNIAEYYAHAPKEVQELMEASALVIIDYDNALRNGYVRLNEDLEALREAEKEL